MKPLENTLIVCEFMLEVSPMLKQRLELPLFGGGVFVSYIHIEFGQDPKVAKTSLVLMPSIPDTKYII